MSRELAGLLEVNGVARKKGGRWFQMTRKQMMLASLEGLHGKRREVAAEFDLLVVRYYSIPVTLFVSSPER